MSEKRSTFIYIYLVICIIDLLFLAFYPLGRLVSKPLIVGSLLAWYIIRLEKQHSLIIGALVLAIAGDICILFENNFFFKSALLCFLFSHLCYIMYLKQFRDKTFSRTQKTAIAAIVILLLLSQIIIFDKTGSNRVYVIIYSLVLAGMAIFAVTFPRIKREISIIGIGALMFALSDMAFAFQKFLQPNPLLSYFVMLTYASAQFLIIKGITDDAANYFEWIKRKKSNG